MKTLLRILALLGLSAVALAQSATGYQSLTVSTTAAVSIDAAVRSGATQCRGRLETNPIRVIWTSATPTATSGAPVSPGDEVLLGNVNDITNFKAIAQYASAVLNMNCTSGTTPEPSRVIPTTTSQLVGPVCNPLLRAAGTPCR
jgi:hypothetical protein